MEHHKFVLLGIGAPMAVALVLNRTALMILSDGRVTTGFPLRICGHAMEPALHDGDAVQVDTDSYRSHAPQRGDIIAFRLLDPDYPSHRLVRRVIALPGETVEVRNGAVYIDGRLLPEPYLREPAMYDFGPSTVPAGAYFVLGGNRNVSYDSSRWPSPWLPAGEIIGRVAPC